MSMQSKIVSHPTITSYIIGFSLSVVLTLFAYILVVLHVNSYHEVISHEVLIPMILGLGFIQLIVQLVFFLHLGNESRPRWNLLFFISTVGLIFIVVAGSIWIMNNLNNNMSPVQQSNYIIHDEGIHK